MGYRGEKRFSWRGAIMVAAVVAYFVCTEAFLLPQRIWWNLLWLSLCGGIAPFYIWRGWVVPAAPGTSAGWADREGKLFSFWNRVLFPGAIAGLILGCALMLANGMLARDAIQTVYGKVVGRTMSSGKGGTRYVLDVKTERDGHVFRFRVPPTVFSSAGTGSDYVLVIRDGAMGWPFLVNSR